MAKTQVSGSGSGDVARVRKAQRQLRRCASFPNYSEIKKKFNFGGVGLGVGVVVRGEFGLIGNFSQFFPFFFYFDASPEYFLSKYSRNILFIALPPEP